MDFDIVQLLHPSTIDIQDKPPIIHVGHYGSPTITLGMDWYILSQGDLPLVVTRSCALPGKCNQRPTALEALALKVPSSGPKVNLTVVAPCVTCRWHVRLDVSGIWPVAKVAKATVLGADPEPLLA
jgi:hypothetical protein